jgi:uncharacterized protein with von Willebrand factor type A (vWA) domain
MGALFPDEWVQPGQDPAKLPPYAIRNDRWDMEDLTEALKKVPTFAAARQRLGRFAGTGEDAMCDAFFALVKAMPELVDEGEIRPSHIVNRTIVEQMLELPDMERLRYYTMGDEVEAGFSAVIIEPDLETLFDRTREAQQRAQELEERLKELAEAQAEAQAAADALGQWAEDHSGVAAPDEMGEQQAAAQGKADEAEGAAQAAGEALTQALGSQKAGIDQVLADAIGEAADQAQENRANARAWGLEPGQLQRMPAAERLALAHKLNSPHLKAIADLFGGMVNLMITEQSRKVDHAYEEIVDVGVGADLARVLPQELLNLRPGPTRLDFLLRFAEGQLLQYEMEGTEKLARGAIILLEDGSSSMAGEREMWAKAVMLCLLHLARQQKREFHLVHFGSRRQSRTISFEKPEDFTFERIIEAAELFWNGGTDFETPMTEALRILTREHAATGKVTADVVMVTDGECRVGDDFMENYLAELKRMSATTWGIDISGVRTPGGALEVMTEGKVATIEDLRSGQNIRQLFRSL